ncbi:filamentous hemagglutinin N-terminal domain-containing protein [Polynucleobacter paneuropaeus]|nr:filamentous hemagglutinin N-terminal domain-containing protein [Polynucleobacter paneuropaeus]
MERSLLSSNHPEKQFDVKLPMAGKVFALVCLFALSTQFALAQNKIAVNALPTGGNVVAGAATISSTSTAKSATMNINQTSQRAVINWQTFNVGKNATVNFNQPNSGSVTLNRVVSATPSMIQGAINANGQVILVNPNGVTFGKGAQVNAAGVVASTLNISNQDFMNGKNIYSGNGEGKIVNKGTITATDPNGYIALLAPEIRNQGYLIARMGPSSTVALASGEKISLDFRGTQLIGVSIDKAAYKALIENKRIIETNGGVIIVAAGTARELMSSVIQNTGRISANSIVDNGGVIELVADNVTNSGSISANGGTNGVGGQVNIVGNNITLAANSQTTATGNLGGGSIQVGVGKTVATNTTPASAVNGNANTAAAPQTAAQILASNTQGVGTQAQTVSVEQGAVIDTSAINSGNGGAIVIWSQVKTTVNGILKAVGGYLNGNGGLIETSSAGLVSLGKSLSIDTSSSRGSAGLWYVDPIDLTINGASSAVISAALVNNNVSITVAGNTCPSLGSCTQNGSGNLTIASGADIIKQSGSLTTLTLTASGVFNLNANISGQNLDVIINSSIAYLNAGSTITANQVTVQAQTIYSYGNINSGSLSNLGSAIQLLGSALYISGNLTVGANLANSSNSTSSNSNTVSYNGTLIRQEDLPTYLAAANQTTLNLDQVYATTAANQASFTTAVNNQITLTGTESISIAATAQLLANGTTGGVIMATAPQINLVTTSNSSPSSGSQSIQGNGSLIQANGNNGPGGTISFTAANDFNINVATISASGSTDGGSIRLISSGGNLLMANSLIQTNGGTGRGGSLGVSGANSTTINSSTLEATGFSKGGSIMVGYDSAGKTLPYSESTTIDAASILSANQTDSTNTTGGGLIETSGGTLTQLASINAGRGGMWLLDPYDYVINTVEAMSISNLLNGGTNVSISTLSPSINLNGQVVNGLTGGGVIYIYSAITATQNTATLTFSANTVYIGANITTRGAQTYNSDVVVLGQIQLSTIGTSGYNGDYTPNSTNLTITGTISGGYAANGLLSLLGGGAWSISTGGTPFNGQLQQGQSSTIGQIPGGILTYINDSVDQNTGTSSSNYTWVPTSPFYSFNTILVVGAGGGGGSRIGNGGSGGQVYGSNLLPQLGGGTTYAISVGLGGAGGNLGTGPSGLNGGNSSLGCASVNPSCGLSTITALGGQGGTGGAMSGTPLGGQGSGGLSPGANAGNGVQVSVVGSSLSFEASGTGTTTYFGGGGAGSGGATTDSAPSYYGYGGIPSTRTNGYNYSPGGCPACDRNGNNGQPNTGMGGGAGTYSYPYVGTGGNGANGVVMIHTVTESTSSLSIQVFQNSVSLNNLNGSGIYGSNLTQLNINAGPLGTNKSSISGLIQGQMNLSFISDATSGTPGAAASALVLSGANTFTGSTTINNGGTLVVANHATLGDPNNNLTLNGTGILDLQYSVSVGNFVMGGTNSITNSAGNSAFQVLGTATLGGSIITSGTQNYYGPVTLIADTTLSTNNRNASGAAINFNGPVNTDPTQILPSSLTTTTVNSFTTFSGAVGALNPIGNLTVNGSSVISANINTQGTQTYKGNVIIGGAKVFLDSTQLDQNFGQAISINGNLDGAGGGATNNLSILSGQAAMTIAGNIGSSNPLASLSLGQINTNGYTYAGQPGGINISGSVNAGATLIINSSYYDNRITGVISGATSVVASGGGGLTLSAVNTYTGSTTIKGDTFFLTADSNLGAAPSTPVIGDLVLDGGYLTVNTSSSFALSPNRWVSIIGSGTIQPGQGATLTIGGNIAGPGVLTKGGYGTLVLGGNNYQLNGNIFVTFGTLQAASAAAFGASGNTVSSAANTTIDLAGASQTASYIFNLNGGVLTNSNGSISAALASGSVIKTSDSVSILSFSGPGILDLSNTVLDDGNRGAAFGGGANVIATNPQNSVAYIASDMANSINLTSSTNLTTSSLVGYSGITRAGTVTLTSSGYITVNTPISSYGNVSLTSNLSSGGSNALTVNAGITSANQNISLNAPYGSISISSALSAFNGSVSIVGGFSNSLSQGNTAIYDTSYITALTISATGTGDPAYVTLGNLNATGSMGNGITVSSKGNITVGSITNTGSAGIKIMAGSGMAAGDISSGGSITSLGPINNSGGAVALSTAAPSVNAGSAGTIEAAIGISPSTASIATNISYGIAGGTLVHPGAYLGNYIDYRQTASVAYSVTLASNYSAVYGTAYNSSSVNAWLLANASVGLTGTGFGYSTSAAGANLRFSSRVNGVADSNVVQTASTITSSSLYSTDGSVITLSGSSRTYTITPAPLGISVNGVYSGTNVITPTSFTTYGLVNGDTIGGLSTATLAFKDVNSVNNYVTAISIGTGSAILSNYQLNPLGRNIATNSALMNSVTLTPIALTVSGAVAANKTYDGTTVATLSASGLNGVLAQDTANVALTLSSGSFANKNVGTNITVTAAGSISGSAVAAGDYTLIQPTVTANISPAPLGVSISGTYTGSTLINNPNIGIAGLVNNEILTSISQAVMSSPNVSANGSNYVVSFTIGAGTASLSNYVINSGYYATPGYTNNMVTLTPKTLTTLGSSAYSKTYDGTNIASINPGTLVGVINSDNVSIFSNTGTFASSNAANNIAVTPNLVLGGTASSNYSLTQPTGLTANISKAPLGISIATTYNGSTTVTPTILNVNGLVNGETLSSITSAVISNANVANTLTTYATSVTIGSGTASMSNYMLGSTRNNSTSSNSENIVTITPKALSLSVVKVYDGATTLSGSQITMTGLIGTQTLNYTGANINDANVATPNKYISSITLTDGANGGLASNYLAPTLTSAYTYNNATVNQKAVALSATKVYDANNTLTGGQVTINTGVGGETLTYSGATVNDINVATAGKYINAITLGNATDGSGGLAVNYALPSLTVASANNAVTITAKVVGLSASKTYDATTTLTGAQVVITTGVGSQTLNYTGATAYSANVSGPNFITAMTLANGTNGGLASNFVLPSLGTFANAPVTITPITLNLSASKVYDATTSLIGAITINGLISGQTLNYSGATAHTSNAGLTYIDAITITDGTGGGLASNYQVPTLTSSYTYNNANITRKVVTLSASKTYDGTTDLTGAVAISGLVGGQTLSYSGAGGSDSNVTTSGKYISAITLTDGANGSLAANYMLPTLGAIAAPLTIVPKALTVTGTTVPDKVYDGSTTTTLAGGTLVGVVARDIGSVTLNQAGTFASPNAGTNVAVVANDSLNLTASAVGNYTLIQPTTTTGNITPKALTVSGTTVDNKTYDGTVAANLTGGTLIGLASGDASFVTLNQNGTFGLPGAGLNLAVTAADSLSGSKASNYTLTQPTSLTANIWQAPLGVTVSGVYNGTTTLAPATFTVTGLVHGETITSITSATVTSADVSGNGSNYVNSIVIGAGTAGMSIGPGYSNYKFSPSYSAATSNTQNIATITPIALTVTGTTVPDKVYDGSTTTTLAGGTLVGVVARDIGSVTLNQAGTFASPNAGTNVAVVANDSLNLTASAVGNYTLIQPTTTTGNITPKSLTVSGTTVANKVYDSTGDATLSGGSLVGLVTGDAAYVSLVQAGTFAQSNVGSAIAVTANNSLTGTKASNYALTQPTGLGADITPKSLGITVTGTYNGTNTIEVTSFTTTGLVAGEVMGSILSATVSDANVATPNKYVGSIAYITGNGARVLWMSNYSISQAYNSTVGSTQNIATITPIALTVTGTTVPNKVYDGSTATTLANGVLNGVISGQAVGLVQAGTFASPNAGNNVAVVASDSLSGNAAVLSNYTLVQPTTTTGNITPAPVTVNNTSVANKVYDGTNVATLTGGTLSGVIAGDAVNVTLNQSGAFANVNVGSGIAVTATDSLSGTKAANYTLTQPSVSAANITPAPLGISITNAVYQASTSLYPVGLNFTVTGLVHGETIATLVGATVANANVSANGSNYITAITVGSGTASLSNYSLNPSYSSATNNMQNKVTLTPMVLTVTGTTVPDKVYDGTTTTTLAGGTLVGVFSTDRNNVSLNQSGTFASPNAGNNVAVVANDSLNLTASAVGNYTLIQPTTTTGNIIKALLGITVTGTYTGSTTLQASGIGFTVSGLLNNETINTLGAVTVSDKNVSANGSNYVTAITIGTGTASMNNYVLTQAYNAISGNTQNTATILTTQLTVVGTSSTTKVYDATNSATLTGGVLAGLKGSDTLTLNQLGTFSNTNVGNNLIITAADSISGTAAGNYTLIQPTGLTGSITPKALTVNGFSVPTKVYDGTTSVVFSNSATLVGVIGSDTVVLNQAGSFVSKNVGSGVAITINDSISGASASNYTLVQPTGVSANITPAPLGLTLTAVYSGSTTITPTSFTTNGLWNGDTITALSSATLSSANVSANASNYITSVTIGGGSALMSNYTSNYITSVTIGGGSALMSNYTINPAYNATPGNTLNTATITPKALTLSASKVYDGSTTGASVNISGLIGGQTLNYSDVRLSDQNVATANKYISAITLADGAGGGIASNYVPPSLSAASASNSVTITPLMVRLSANKEYDGTTSLTGKVTISGLVGSETLNYTGATAISPNVGANYINAIALADGTNGGLASNYQIPNLTLAYTNNNAQVTAKAISISATKVYDATADLMNAITITGLIGNQTLNYSGATANSANVLGASYINAITFTDGANGGLERNYIVPTLTGSNTNNSVSITAAPLSLSGTKIYDGSRIGGTGTLNIGGLIGAQTLSSSDVTVNDPNVGTDKYITAITLADGANGGITSNYALPNLTVASARNIGSITPRDLTITVSAQTKTYGDGIAQTSNTQDGSINLTPVSGHTSGTASNVDTRTTALSDIQYVNYTGNTANNSTAGFSVDGLVANDVVRTVNISSSGGALTANANVNGVLAYAITASGAVGTGLSNYNISYVANNYSVLTITPRKLVVTAATATMVYGASALPTLSTSSITGWANTADQAITSIALSAQDATGKLVKANIGGVAGSPVVGTYSVVATGVNGNPNYVIDTVNSTPGQFTIAPASLTITANSLGGPGAPILYGTPTVLKPDAFTSSGLTNGDSLSTATITFNSATTIAGTTTPGIYTPVVSGPSSTGGLQISGASGPTFVASNYVINYVAGSLTIGQAKLTVSAVNDAKLQGQQDANGYNGVIVSGFVNGDTLSVLNTTGLSITRNNAVNNTAPGTYNGVLIASGVSLADLNSTNYSIAYQPGNFTIVPPNQLLIKVAPVTTQYGSAIYTGSSPVTATYLTSLGSSPQSINALISGGGSNYQVNLGSGQSSASAPLVIGTAADISSSGNLNVGSYNLSPIAQQINLQGTGLTSAVAVGGISITPKTLSFADLGSVTLTKDYDGKASSTVPVPALSSTFLSGDNVTATASGTFTNLITGMPDANAGNNKSYTIAVSFSPKLTTPGANQTDANNYVLTGGGIYTADGGTGINHGPANGVINVLDSVNYIGAASGAAWSSASSWANGAVPTYANVRNIIVPVGFSVVYDAGVAGPVSANLQNAGNVNFNTDMGLAISMNISGAGSITISGTGQVSLSGNNTYTGNAIINNGAKLVATYGNTIGAGNIQGLGGTFQTTPGTIFTQINATGSLILASDITTTGNQTYGNITFSQPRTTLLSQFGSITINGTVDSGTANVNTLLLQAPTGSVSLRGSVGSIKPLNVLEIDAVSTYLYADVLTADQQNYCGAAGCYTAITPAQVTASYCATNDCYSKNNDTSAYNLLASGTGGSGNFAKSANIGQLFIGDVGQVGFLYNKYNQYASKSVADGGFGTPTPLFNNNSVYARTLMSMDPTVNLGSYVSDVSVTPTHTIQVAAIQATGVTASPTIQMSGSGKTQSTSALYSLSALTQGATWAGTYSDSAPIEAANYIALGSKALNLNNASLTAPTLNLVYPPSGTLTTNASSSFTANNASINGRATTTIGGRSLTPYTPATPSPSGVTGARSLATPATPTTRNSFILAAVAEQTKIERKYDVDASVDVGEIETDDGPAAADDQDDKKKKKAGNQKAAQ